MRALYLLLPALVAAALPAAAQRREMEVDRPNRTNTPSTVDAGLVQVELGVFDTAVDRDGADDRTRTWTLGETNARIGVTDSLELNILTDPHVAMHERGEPYARGFGDTTVGLKWNLWGNGGEGATALAIQPQVKLPTAAAGVGNGNVEVDVNVPFTVQGPAGFGLGVQPTVSWLRSEGDTHYVAGWQLSAAIDHDVGPADLYLEYAASDTAQRAQPAAQLLGLGTTVKAGKNLVLDAGTEIGLSRGADDFRVFTGVSARF